MASMDRPDRLAFTRVMQRGGFSEEVAEEFATMQEARFSELVTAKDLAREMQRLMDYMDKRFAESEARMMRWTLTVGAFVIAAVSIIVKVF